MKNRLPGQDDVVSLAVLSLLVEKPCHPYEMQRLIKQRGKTFVTGLPRSLYRAVDRLAEAELIEAAQTEREGGRPERTIFRITDEGRAEFYTWLTGLLAHAPLTPSLFNVAISFLPNMTPSDAAKVLQIRLATLEAHLRPAESILEHVSAHVPRVCLLEVEHFRAILRAELDWLLSLLSDLDSGALSWTAVAGTSISNEK